ncbi:MAG: LLM class F420-dependent oxidoreductase [Chloroflexota bacterium]
MHYGIPIPSRGSLATPAQIRAIASSAEAKGFDLITVADHIVIPHGIASKYPYSESGAFVNTAGDWIDIFAMLGLLAGVTSRVKLLTAVLVVPYRHPVTTAKMLASIDYLSGGRLIVGCGTGWMEEEFVLVGAPPFAQRGAVTSEYLQAFRELWTNPDPHFDGEFVHFSEASCDPKPVQRPHPPLWIGGESGPAIRRAATLGDGWFPMPTNPTRPLDTLERFKPALDEMRGYAERAGRDPAAIQLCVNSSYYSLGTPNLNAEGQRRSFSGSAEQIAADIAGYQALGAGTLLVRAPGASVTEINDSMDRFNTEVLPLVG